MIGDDTLCVEDDILFSKDMTKLISYPMSKTDEEYVDYLAQQIQRLETIKSYYEK